MRDVPISPKVHGILRRVIEETQPSALLFYGQCGRDTPMSKSVTEHQLAQALEATGIPRGEQRQRNISFHALRYYNGALVTSKVLRSEGWTFERIAETLNEAGHRTRRGRPFGATTVRRLLLMESRA